MKKTMKALSTKPLVFAYSHLNSLDTETLTRVKWMLSRVIRLQQRCSDVQKYRLLLKKTECMLTQC